jgi:hypothetical protein
LTGDLKGEFGKVARSKSMKTHIITIGLSANKRAEVQAELADCLREHGGTTIGYQMYDDLTLLVVRPADETFQKYFDTLATAMRKELITSFQVVYCQIFKVIFRHEGAKSSLKNFPLRVGESWCIAAEEETAVYICLDSPNLSQEQIAWLATQTAIAQWTKAS